MTYKKVLLVIAGFASSYLSINAVAGDHSSCSWGKTENKTGSIIKESEIKTSQSQKISDYHVQFQEIKQSELVTLVKKKAVFLVDANSSQTYNKNHIPGAIHLNSANFEKQLPNDKSALIVAYCGGPGCQAWCKAAEKLDAMGYKNIRHYRGGIKEWLSAGLDVGKVDKEG